MFDDGRKGGEKMGILINGKQFQGFSIIKKEVIDFEGYFIYRKVSVL